MNYLNPLLTLITCFIFISSVWSQDLLEVEGDILLNSNTPELRFYDTADSRTEGRIREDGDALQIIHNVGNFEIMTPINNALINSMTVEYNTGFVGLGIENPIRQLDVDGETWLRDDLTIDDSDLVLRSANNHTNRMRTDNNGDLRFLGDGAVTTMLLTDHNGRLGINTISPALKLHVVSTSDASPSGGGIAQFGLTSGDNVAIDANEILARNNGQADDLLIQHNGGDLILCGQENGKVGIGVLNMNNIPNDYILGVDGRVITEEVRVELSSAWPDYVFESDYQLKSIETLEEEINLLGHLPGIPSASDIETNGLLLGDMQRMMMEKIEELSLYVIQQQHQIKDLQSQILNIKSPNDEN